MSRTPLIVLPGWGMSHTVFEPLFPELERRFELFPLDWHGIQDQEGFQYHVRSWITRPSFHHFSIMGWSLGSMVALETAVLYPSK